MTNYSQNNEQSAILAAFASDPFVGTFLDIGAWHPTDKSNTRALYEQGWTGVMVEPSPGPFSVLVAEYGGGMPRLSCIQLINAAVTFESGTVEMWVTDDAVSTADQANYEKWKNHAKFNGKIQVKAVTLEEIFAEHGEFDFVSIDAEGTSTDLMHRMFELGHFPKCVVVEHDNRTNEILSDATARGYACTLANGENLVLVKQ